MKIKMWEISTRKVIPGGRYGSFQYGTFEFAGDNKVLAHDHAMTLKHDIDFEYLHGKVMVSENVNERVRSIAVRFIGWREAS